MKSEILKKFEVLETHPRPAKLEECYCGQKVGEFHTDDCVLIKVIFLYEIKDLAGLKLAEWVVDDPYGWNYDDRYFHKNEGSWCSSNLFTQGQLIIEDQLKFQEIIDSLAVDENYPCICGHVKIIPIKSIGTPFMEEYLK